MPLSKSPTQQSFSTRSIVADLARLIKEEKLSAEELSRIDKGLLSQAETYAATLDLGMIDLQSLRQGTQSISDSGIITNSPSLSSSNARPSASIKPDAQTAAPSQVASSLHAAYSAARFTPTSAKNDRLEKPKFTSPIKAPLFKKDQKEKADFSKLKEELENELDKSSSEPDTIFSTQNVSPQSGQRTSNASPLSSIVGMPQAKIIQPIQTPIVSKPLTEQERLEAEEKQFEKNVENISYEEKAANEDVATATAKLQQNFDYFTSVVEKEKKIEIREKEIRTKEEAASSLKERKVIEEERWAIEDERQHIEEERWQKGQEKKQIEKELEEKKVNADALTKRKQAAEAELEKTKLKRQAIKAKSDLSIYQSKLEEVEAAKKKGEADWQAQNQAGIKAKTDLESNAHKRKELDQKIIEIENRQKKVTSEEIRHINEEERWKIVQELRETEKAGWHLEESIEEMETLKESLLTKFAEYQTEEETLKMKIKELQDIINKAATLL